MTGLERHIIKYAPSAEKVLPEESDDRSVRANADLFVDTILHAMDGAEHGPNSLIPTPHDITQRYEGAQREWRGPDRIFTLGEAYGAARRRLLFEEELAAEWGNNVGKSSMKNIGDLYILATAIQLTSPS